MTSIDSTTHGDDEAPDPTTDPFGDDQFAVAQTLIDVFVYEHPDLLQHAMYGVDDRQGAEDILHEAYRDALAAADELHDQDVEYLAAWMRDHITQSATGFHERTRTPSDGDDVDFDRLEEVFERFADRDNAVRDLAAMDDAHRFLIVLAACRYTPHEIATALSLDEKKVPGLVADARVAFATTAPRTRKACAEARTVLAALTPPPAKKAASTEQHIRTCESCRAFRDTYSARHRALGQAIPTVLIQSPDQHQEPLKATEAREGGITGRLPRIPRPTARNPRILIAGAAAAAIAALILIPRLTGTQDAATAGTTSAPAASTTPLATTPEPPPATTTTTSPQGAGPANPMAAADAVEARDQAAARAARAEAARKAAAARAERAARRARKARAAAQRKAAAAAARRAASAPTPTPTRHYTAPRTYTPTRSYTTPRRTGGGGGGSAAGEFTP